MGLTVSAIYKHEEGSGGGGGGEKEYPCNLYITN